GLVEEDDRKWDRSRGGRISYVMKKSNIGDNTGDGGKVVSETIGTCGGIRVGLTHSQIKKKYFPVKLGNSPERPGDNLGKLKEKPSSTSKGSLLEAMNISSNWDDMIQKAHRRLATWKVRLLSISRCLTLCKSVIGSLGVFYMSMFKIPELVSQKLESIQA
nr:RNA-directed DNA polymerase, eukaryota [Tanacetum cinerariifolium]